MIPRIPALIAAVALAGCASATGAPKPTAQPTPTSPNAAQASAAQQTAARSGLKPFAEITREATARTGFFDTYEKDDKVWIAVPRERLGKDFLMEMKLAQGIGANGLYGGSMLNLFEADVMTLERRGDQVFLLQRPSRFTGGRDDADRSGGGPHVRSVRRRRRAH